MICTTAEWQGRRKFVEGDDGDKNPRTKAKVFLLIYVVPGMPSEQRLLHKQRHTVAKRSSEDKREDRGHSGNAVGLRPFIKS